MSGGTVNISRSIWKHTAFKAEPFTEREAFMWMIMDASYKTRVLRHPVTNQDVELKRGQLVGSVRFMAEPWGWSKSKVDRFLKRLEKRDMIGTDSGTGINLITICNYDTFQNMPDYNGTAENEKRDSSGTAAGQQRDKPNKDSIPDVIPEGIKDPPVSPKPKKSRLPEEWAPSDEDMDYARSLKINEADIREIADDFHAYWTDRTDAGGSKSARGWRQTWRNRCRDVAPKFARNRGVALKTIPGGYGQGGGIAGEVARRRAAGEN